MAEDDIWGRYVQGKLPEIDGELEVQESEDGELVLDLHHHSEDQAYVAIQNMLQQAQKLSVNKLKIITGRGSGYPETPGKLFLLVPKWLEVMREEGKIKKIRQEMPGEINLKL